jgi:ParB-like partition proteins
MKKRGLGRGLDVIFAENAGDAAENSISIKISEIEPNREQPRKEFDSEALAELADSISQHGILQPLLLRPMIGGGYRIVAGERRWRASRMAGLTEVPAVVREMTDTEEMLFALIENLQREDLTPLEEAKGYRTLIETQDFTQEEVSRTVGKSRPAVTNALRLLNLPEIIQNMLEDGRITAGHARTLLSFQNEEEMIQGAEKAAEGMSVRELEKLAKSLNEKKTKTKKIKTQAQYYEETQLALGSYLNRKVKVSGTKKKGVLQIEFYGEEDLKNLIAELELEKN